MPRCALPDKIVIDPKGNEVNLKDARHWDWPWPMCYIKRSLNAFGPRCRGKDCECGGKGFKFWPPILMEGRGVSRWEAVGPGHSIIYIPALDYKTVKREDLFGTKFRAIEMNKGLPTHGDVFWVEFKENSLIHKYSPSALQTYSPSGYMELDPPYFSWWKWWSDKDPNQPRGPFFRWGYRPDHEDWYYNWGPFLGFKPE